MRVERNQSIYVGNRTENQNNQAKGRKSLFAGDLNQGTDPILQKKQEAQRKALKVVSDAWEGDQQIDEDITSRREHIKKAQAEMGEARKELSALEQQQSKLLQQFEETGNAELREQAQSMQEHIDYYRKQVDGLEGEIQTESAVIRGIKLERLKSAPMVKAQKEADAIMEAASEEIVGMLVEEGKEHIDEEVEKQKERAEAVEEKKEVQDIVNKMKLVAEDIKGARVDEMI